MAQLDDSVGGLLKHLQDIGEADNTIVIFTTDNGAEVFTWPDGGMTPFKATKGTIFEGGFRVPCIIRWPGKIKPGTVENGIFSGLDWLPTLSRRCRKPQHRRAALERSDAGRPRRTRTIWTGTIRWTCCLVRDRRRGTKSSTSEGRSSERSASTISSSCSSSSPMVGRERS